MGTSEGATSIGFIGLGHMGGHMAVLFLAAVHTVHARSAAATTHSTSWSGAPVAGHAA